MRAEVAKKESFSKLNAAKTNPLIAPPVPTKPAKKPEEMPPTIKFLSLCSNFLSELKIKKTDNKIRTK